MRRPTVVLIALAAFAWGVAWLVAGHGLDQVHEGAPLAALGWSFVAAGLVASSRTPHHRTGVLMIAAGFAWFIGAGFGEHAKEHPVPLAMTLAWVLSGLATWITAHLVIAFPRGRLRPGFERRLVVFTYVASFLWAGGATLLISSRELCDTCTQEGNLLLISHQAWAYDIWAMGDLLLGVGIAAVVLGVLVKRWRTASPVGRRVLAPVIGTGMVVAAVLLINAVVTTLVEEPEAVQIAILVVTFGLIPMGFLVGLLRANVTRSSIGPLLARLDPHPTAESLESLLREALDDPSFRIGYVHGSWLVAHDGQALPDDPALTKTEIRAADGSVAAVFVHDPLLSEEAGLLEATGSAARLALENARLQADLQAQLSEARASRERLVAARTATRREIERRIEQGAQARLNALGMSLEELRERVSAGDATAGALLSEARAEVDAAVAALRETASGLREAAARSDAAEASDTGGRARNLTMLETLIPELPFALYLDIEADAADSGAAAYEACARLLESIAARNEASTALVRAARTNGDLLVEVWHDAEQPGPLGDSQVEVVSDPLRGTLHSMRFAAA